jgi:hypothetical protein
MLERKQTAPVRARIGADAPIVSDRLFVPVRQRVIERATTGAVGPIA